MIKFIVFLIRGYQRVLSPDHSWLKFRYPYGFCPFSPTCSEYAVVALEKFGLIGGLGLIIKRLSRCRPGQMPAIDQC